MIGTVMLLAAAAAVSHCSWDNPGTGVFTGNVPAAIEAYSDIPAPVRKRLRERMERRQYDEVVEIRRETIVGKTHDYSDLREMHFGNGQRCKTVSRSQWPLEARERGLVYCESEHCVIVPTVCRNVSLVTRKPSSMLTLETLDVPFDTSLALIAPPAQSYDQPTRSRIQSVPSGTSDSADEQAFAGSGFGSSESMSPWGGESFAALTLPPSPFRYSLIVFQPTTFGTDQVNMNDSAATEPIPEPSTYGMFVLGLLCLAAARAWRLRAGSSVPRYQTGKAL